MPNLSNLTTKQKIFLISGIAAVVLLTTLILIFLVTHPVVAGSVRDVFIILLAIQVFVLDVLMLVMLWQILKLLDYLIRELVPVINSLQETVGTVRGTTTFMSDNVVTPTIEVASKVAGIRRSVSVLFAGPGSSQARPKPAASASSAPPASPEG